jgi:hypothetical protein
VKVELVIAAGQRVARGAADALISAAGDPDPEVRREAMRALRNAGGPAQTAPLLQMLLKASTASERRDAAQTLAAVLRSGQPASMSAVVSAYNSAGDLNARLSLIDVMGQTSSNEALPLLRSGLKDASTEIARAAILALSNWDNSTPLTDLFDFAKAVPQNALASEPEPVAGGRGGRGGRGGFGGPPPTNNLKVLAVRGVLKLMVLQSDRTASASGRMLGETMALATQNPEKLLALSLLPVFPSQESLEVAQAATRDPAVVDEAKVAVAQVAEALKLK